MTNTTTSTADAIEYLRIYIICRYLYLIVFSLGIIGNICNLIVFFRKKFRTNSCSIYFIAYSINNFMSLTVGLFLWSLTLGFNFNLEYESVVYCKIRRYVAHFNYLLSSCLLTMASINRYARVRQAQLTQNCHRYILFCEFRTTYVIVIATIIFCLISNIHIPILFQIDEGHCYARVGSYRLVFDIFVLIFYGICLPVIMIAANVATVIHIRSIKRLVHPTISRREYNLIILVISHSIANLILTLPYIINRFVHYRLGNAISAEIDKLIFSITLLISFMNPALSFFLYTLTTRSFRHEFVRACKGLLIKGLFCYCRNKLNDDKKEQDDTVLSRTMALFTKTSRTL